MKTISVFKYPVPPYCGVTEIQLPKNSKLLHFGPDPQSELCVWAQVDTNEKETEAVRIMVLGTGDYVAVQADGHPIEYFQSCNDGKGFMWHLYYLRREPTTIRYK